MRLHVQKTKFGASEIRKAIDNILCGKKKIHFVLPSFFSVRQHTWEKCDQKCFGMMTTMFQNATNTVPCFWKYFAYNCCFFL
jgi:hypothetical protein